MTLILEVICLYKLWRYLMAQTHDANSIPDNLWDVDAQLQFNEALSSTDERYVDTSDARGDYNLARLYRNLGVDERTMTLRAPKPRSYTLFCGHRGCGKSTELRRLAKQLHRPEAFFVVFLDATVDLDHNNLQYADALLALAKALFAKLEDKQIALDALHLHGLESWFKERIETDSKTKDFALEIKAGIKTHSGIPFLGKLFADISTAVKNNSSYKAELRRIVHDSFGQFSQSFNRFVVAVEDALQTAGQGQKILFVLDGTDRLSEKDGKRFFIGDVHQLKQIDANFIYCAPIHLLYQGNQVQQEFTHFILPMIKLREKGSEDTLSGGYDCMRKMIDKRVVPALFDAPETLDMLIEYSGGSPRELFKLMHYAFLRCTQDVFDHKAAAAAVNDLSVDYKRILDSGDYPLLVEIDHSPQSDQNSERVRYFLYHLVLLEYNGFWRQSHPVVRRLAGYTHAVGSHP